MQSSVASSLERKEAESGRAPVTPGYWLKKQYLPSRSIGDDHSLDQYMEKLKREGAWINPCLQPAFFETRNHLKYPGIVTTKTLAGPEVLVRIPKRLLLNTRVCLNQPLLHEVYKEQFYRSSSNWEDRVLATYLLWTYSRKQGIWYDMLLHMSKDIDVLCFWPQADLLAFNDKAILRASKKALQRFELEWEQFRLVMAKHHTLLPQELVTRQNYQWLYIHLVSRCFGRYLECITMVPFCQFFNHHITDVLYDFGFQPGNPYKNEQSKYPSVENYRTQQQRAMVSSSDGSYSSVDYDEQNEFDYSDINVHKISWCSKVSDRLKEKEQRAIDIAWKDLNDWLLTNIDWRDWSVFYVAQALQKLNILRNEYTAGRLMAEPCLKDLAALKSECNSYRTQTVKFYSQLRGSTYKYSTSNYSERKSSTDSYEQQKQFPRLNEDKFDEFILRMNKRDYFQQGNQVYFCYGRLSNRMMLERYGVALEGNKFDHVWLRVDLLKYLEGYPDVLEVMQLRSLSLKRKFKIKRREFCLQLVQFVRTSKWSAVRNRLDELYYPFDLDREYSVLGDTITLLQKQLSYYQDEKVLDYRLTTSDLSYHGYFATVYKLQHVRILTLHIELLQLCQQIVRKLKDGIPYQLATQPTPNEQRKYHYLKGYIDRLRHYRK